MSSNTINEDLRRVKTKKALYTAIFSLLKNSSFRKITIREICEEALTSRATFYAHFVDKYDLLKHWMIKFWPKDFDSNNTYEQVEKAVNHHINEGMLILKNLLYDADDETLGILFEFILSTVNLTIEKNKNGEDYPKNVVLSNFYAGGILSYLQWQIRNKFPLDLPLMNRDLYEMIQELLDWQ